MKQILIAAILITASFIKTNAQDLHSLKLESISADWKVTANTSSDFLLDSLNQLQEISKSHLPSPADLNTYHLGGYQIKIETGSNIFESPHGPVNTQNVITYSQFDLTASFSLLNHKTNEYREKSEISFGLFYLPAYYHPLRYARTDTITSDSLIFNYVYYDEWTSMLGIQGAYLFRTNVDKWISAYAGAGIGVGLSVHPQITETYGAMSDKISIDSVGGAFFPSHFLRVLSNHQNTFSAKPSLLFEGKIPFGLNFRVFKPLDLFLEGEVIAYKQVYFQNGPSFPIIISGSLGIGLKYKI